MSPSMLRLYVNDVMISKENAYEGKLSYRHTEHFDEKVDSFKYLGIDIPSNHAWGQCVKNRIDAGQAKYYQFESMCMQKKTSADGK